MTSFYIQLLVNGLIAGSVYAMIAVGLTMVYGVCRFINFAHGELVAWAAYLCWMFTSPRIGMPFPAAVLLALAMTALIGLIQNNVMFQPLRNKGAVSLLIASIGMSYFLRSAIQFFWGSDIVTFNLPVSRGLTLMGLTITRTQLLMAVAAVASFAILWFLLNRTLLGKSLRAVSDHQELAGIMAIDLKKTFRTVWVLAALFAGSGGILLAVDTSLEPTMGLANLVKAFAAVLLGGAGTVWGALAGGIMIGVAENLSVAVVPTDYKDFIAFASIFLLLLVKPRGIFSVATGVR
jgi:branched-chain amino acid transport system permease protein/neutral amino acid transport system permease protein